MTGYRKGEDRIEQGTDDRTERDQMTGQGKKP